MKALGIDLAGSPARPTGACFMGEDLEAHCLTVFSDEELLGLTAGKNVDIIAIDAPLTLPVGRPDIDVRNEHHFRGCDRELLARKIKFFPITLGPMRSLTKRGMMLSGEYSGKGYCVIEVYPGAAQDIMNVARQKYPGRLLSGLRGLGIKNLDDSLSVHELDAVTSAYVGIMHLAGKTESIGEESDGFIVLPAA